MDPRSELAPRATGLGFLGPRAATTATSPAAAAAGLEPSTGTCSATATARGTRTSRAEQLVRAGNGHRGNE